MSEQAKGFWSSFQGVLTGIAAVITAATGLYIAINGDNTISQPAETDVEVGSSASTRAAETTLKSEKKATQIVQTAQRQQPRVEVTPPNSSPVKQTRDKAPFPAPFPETGPLVDCTAFPTVNTVSSLMSWSNYYHKQITAANGINKRAFDPCNKTIDYRGMAHCREPNNAEVRDALLETLTLCRAAGIEWPDIKHSTIIGQE